jgi:hypothetical protein
MLNLRSYSRVPRRRTLSLCSASVPAFTSLLIFYNRTLGYRLGDGCLHHVSRLLLAALLSTLNHALEVFRGRVGLGEVGDVVPWRLADSAIQILATFVLRQHVGLTVGLRTHVRCRERRCTARES